MENNENKEKQSQELVFVSNDPATETLQDIAWNYFTSDIEENKIDENIKISATEKFEDIFTKFKQKITEKFTVKEDIIKYNYYINKFVSDKIKKDKNAELSANWISVLITKHISDLIKDIYEKMIKDGISKDDINDKIDEYTNNNYIYAVLSNNIANFKNKLVGDIALCYERSNTPILTIETIDKY